ncbi:MAG: hypothetical protein GY696_25065 [Gammaproteobacteria bacterium]|nr:hypothetical protein [Gammaproteobacteria bacterium]
MVGQWQGEGLSGVLRGFQPLSGVTLPSAGSRGFSGLPAGQEPGGGPGRGQGPGWDRIESKVEDFSSRIESNVGSNRRWERIEYRMGSNVESNRIFP